MPQNKTFSGLRSRFKFGFGCETKSRQSGANAYKTFFFFIVPVSAKYAVPVKNLKPSLIRLCVHSFS
jgi:hypothetical protein